MPAERAPEKCERQNLRSTVGGMCRRNLASLGGNRQELSQVRDFHSM